MQTPQILQMLQNPQLGQLRQMIGALRSAGNPQALLQQMMQQRSPQMAQALDYIKQHGGDPRATCEALAAERGIDLKDLGL